MSRQGKKGVAPALRFSDFTEDWHNFTLDEVAKYRRGSFPQPYGLVKWYDDENGVPFVQVVDVGSDMKLKSTTKRKISAAACEQSVFIAKGTVIITLQGSIGRVAVTHYDAYIDRTLLLFQKFLKPINKYFFTHILQILFDIEKQKAPGGIIKTITKEALSSFIVKFPEIREQQKIADCLSSIDELITAHTQKLEALKAHKKGLMQQLFPAEGETVPKLRFPEFRDTEDWVVEKFGDITDFASGGTPSMNRKEYWDGDIPWISAASMHHINIKSSDKNITQLAVDDGARLVVEGTLLLLVRGSMLHKRIPIGITKCTAAFNQDVKALKLKKNVIVKFLLYLLIASEKRLLGAVSKTGIGAGKLDTNDLKDFLICVPDNKEEQEKIASFLSTVDTMLSAQIQKIQSLKTHKKGLMQQLFPSIDEVGA